MREVLAPISRPIGHVRDHVGRVWITLTCRSLRCLHSATLDPASLLRFGAALSCAELASRARCVRCGLRGAEFRLQAGSRPDQGDRPPG